jgi:hypothetical protein
MTESAAQSKLSAVNDAVLGIFENSKIVLDKSIFGGYKFSDKQVAAALGIGFKLYDRIGLSGEESAIMCALQFGTVFGTKNYNKMTNVVGKLNSEPLHSCFVAGMTRGGIIFVPTPELLEEWVREISNT